MRYFVPKEYLFEQATPAAVWTISHACGNPSVDTYVTENGVTEKIIPSQILYVSDTQVQITFSKPFAGFAKIVG